MRDAILRTPARLRGGVADAPPAERGRGGPSLCFLGLLVLASLALFSVRYRSLAQRGLLDCFFRRVTLRAHDRPRQASESDGHGPARDLASRRRPLPPPPPRGARVALRRPGRRLDREPWLRLCNYPDTETSAMGPRAQASACSIRRVSTGCYMGVVTGHRGETVKLGDGGNPALGPRGRAPHDHRVRFLHLLVHPCERARGPGGQWGSMRARCGWSSGTSRSMVRHVPLWASRSVARNFPPARRCGARRLPRARWAIMLAPPARPSRPTAPGCRGASGNTISGSLRRAPTPSSRARPHRAGSGR